MKVIISQRVVYHKYSEVEIEIDEDDFEDFELQNTFNQDEYFCEASDGTKGLDDYLMENAHLYDEQLNEAHDKAEYKTGTGLYDGSYFINDIQEGMDDAESDWEIRYDCVELKTGGHL